jgi:outer membrane immunogenic protein
MTIKMLATVLTVVACAGGASAADLGNSSYDRNGTPALIEAPGDYTAFRGAYAGVQGGWSTVDHDMKATETPSNGDAVDLFSLSSAGAGGGMFGVNGGYNFTAGRFLVGPYAEFNWANNSVDLAIDNGKYTAKLAHDDEWSIGGRLGYLVSPQTVAYGLVAFTSADTSISTSSSTPIKGLEDGVNFHGYTLGVGAESFVTRDVSLKLEGRWTQFSKATLYNRADEEKTVTTVTSEPSEVAVMVGVNYHPRFGVMDALK